MLLSFKFAATVFDVNLIVFLGRPYNEPALV